jgi:diguanylate cyclase (GGDEF)-like protein/PAS domain S-box-containing protein
MLPLAVTKECLKCHAAQGYRVGDNRGGIGAYVDLKPYLDVEAKRRNELALSHGAIWLIGLFALYASHRRETSSIVQSNRIGRELQKLSKALEQSPTPILLTDLAGKIEYVNQAFVKVTGYNHDEVIGQNVSIRHDKNIQYRSHAEGWDRIDEDGSWEGELISTRKDGTDYVEWERISPIRDADGRISHYLVAKEDITLRKAAEEDIKHLAFYDHLTQLPNRKLMLDRLTQALTSSVRHGKHGALMLIDLDNFKTLNDTLGHAVGDQLLIEAAARLKSCVRQGDTVARLGGDEFVVILEGLDADERAAVQAEAISSKIESRLGQPYHLTVSPDGDEMSERSHQCTSSIGITLFRDQSIAVDELLKRADTAMYQAKAAGRNTACFFDPEMQTIILERAAMEIDLRKAIVENQFVLYYQAQVDSAGCVIGAEALVRWQHPERGMISPADFIPLAEETGLILPLGHWVMETACYQLASWASNPEMAHLTVAVNVSARQFRLPNIVEQVLALVSQVGANPLKLKLELTESLLLENADDIIVKMAALKGHGVGFSLDDFGTGYSSLSYLKRLPLDQLKIDQSFVRDILTDPNDAAIAQTIVALGQSLGLAVIAEGVESEGQRDWLASHGCQTYQGYFFSRPIPKDAFESYVKNLTPFA